MDILFYHFERIRGAIRFMKINPLTMTFLILVLTLFISMESAVAQENGPRPVDMILTEMGDIPTVEAIRELFIYCSEWDEKHSDVKDDSKQALIDLGIVVVPTLLEGWIGSVDLRRRIELDNIVGEIGHPSAEYIIPYLEDEDAYSRRHAAYLLGDTAHIQSLDDPLAIGPYDEDIPAIETLTNALTVENDWHVLTSIIGAIGKMRDLAQIDLIASYLNDDEQAIRMSAVIALGRIPDQLVIPHIMGAFSDPVINVRQAAVLAVSTGTMGNLAFEAIVGNSILSPGGMVPRLCALESLARYLDVIAVKRDERSEEQRTRAFDAAVTVIENAVEYNLWQVRGYAVDVIGYTYDNRAGNFLEELAVEERHPFVVNKINKALERLATGQPVPVENGGGE